MTCSTHGWEMKIHNLTAADVRFVHPIAKDFIYLEEPGIRNTLKFG
jgi:hypothetical protein